MGQVGNCLWGVPGNGLQLLWNALGSKYKKRITKDQLI